MVVTQGAIAAPFTNGVAPTVSLLPTDNANFTPNGWAWTVIFSQNPPVDGAPANFSFDLPAGPANFTATNASPCVFTWTPTTTLTTLPAGTGIKLSGGSVPAGFTAGTTYYVINSSGSTFNLAATVGGSAINSTGSGSGTLSVVSMFLSALTPLSPTIPTIAPFAPGLSANVVVTASGAVATNVVTEVDASTGNKAMTLPAPVNGAMVVVEKWDTTGNTVTISGSIRDSAASVTLQAQYQSYMFLCWATTWWPVAYTTPTATLDLRYPVWYSVKWYGAKGDGVTDDHTAFQNAVNAANTAGGGIVYVPASSYYIGSRVTLKTGVTIVGDGIDSTVLISGVAFDYVFYSSDSVNGLQDSVVQDMTINVNNVSHGAGYRIEYATRVSVLRVRFLNVSNGWGAVVGIGVGSTSTYVNTQIKFQDCYFDTQNSTLEMLLIMNTQHMEVINCDFYNNTASSGPALGIYQVCDDIRVSNSTFRSITGPALYYSLSCNNITVDDCAFYGASGGTGIQGTNLSDNGAFGYGWVFGLTVSNCYFTGLAIAVELGATKGAVVDNCNFESNYNIPILIHQGNQGVSNTTEYWIITNSRFRNNNTQNTLASLHPCILFQGVGGSMFGRIEKCNIWDDSAGGAHTQIYPICFVGAFTWDYIKISNCYFQQYATTNAAQQLFLFSSAVNGSHVITESSTFATGSVTLPVNTAPQLKGFSVAMGIALG